MKKYSMLIALVAALVSVTSAFADRESTCAILFSGGDFNGPNFTVEEGARIADLRDYRVRHHCENWNNESGSMLVMPGCRVTAFQYDNFDINYNNGREMGGQIRNFPNDGYRVRHVSFEGDGFFKLMSSLTCECR